MIKFQSRIKIYLLKFFFVRFFFNLVMPSRFFTKNIELLEEDLAKLYNSKNSKLVGQCREGLYWSIKYSIESTKKKEVIISPYTLFYVINMIIHAGGKPVFVDLKKDSLETPFLSIKEKICKDTACVVLTNLTGIHNEIEEIKFLKETGIFVIEDMAVSMGSRTKNNSDLELMGDIGILSFQAMKNIQCLNGGALIYSNKKFHSWINDKYKNIKEISKIFLIKRLLFIYFVNFFSEKKIFNFIFFQLIKIAYFKNYSLILKFIRPDHNPYHKSDLPKYYFKKISEIQAKFLRIQLKNIFIDQDLRKKTALVYKTKLRNIKEIRIIDESNFDYRNHLEFPILCENRDDLFFFLLKKNIDVRKFYYRNCSKLKIYKKYFSECPNADKMEKSILSLPCYPGYSIYNVNKIINEISEFYKKKI